MQSARLVYFNLHLQYNNNDCSIVAALLVSLNHLLAEKKMQFAENFSLQYFACAKPTTQVGKKHKEVEKRDHKIMFLSDYGNSTGYQLQRKYCKKVSYS